MFSWFFLMKCLIKNILLFILLLLPGYVISQGSATIFGIITDSLGTPVDLVNITIPESSSGTMSDENGRYHLVVPADKEMQLLFSCVGFVSQSQKIYLRKNEKREISVRLMLSEKRIDEVTILAKQDKYSNIEKLVIKDIKFIPDVSGNFEALLKSMPGVSSANELSSQYSVRGGNFDENLVYVNDIEIYRPFLIRSSQQEGLSFINADMVSGVEFSSGGFNAEFGDKMSSVLNVHYRRPYRNSANLALSLLGANVTLEGIDRKNRISVITGLRYKTSEYLLNTLDVKGDYQPSYIDIQSLVDFSLTQKVNLSFLGSYSSNQFRFTPETRETKFGTFDNPLLLKVFYEGQELSSFETMLGALTLGYKVNENLNLKLITRGFITHEQETFDILGQYLLNELDNTVGSSTYGDSLINVGIGGFLNHARNYMDANVLSLEHIGQWSKDNNRFKWGLRYQHEIIEDKISEWDAIDSSGYLIPYNNDNIILSYSLKSSNSFYSDRIQGFIQDEYKISGTVFNITATLGARFSYWSYNDEFNFGPRGSITFSPSWRNDLLFHLSGGYYNQPPFYKELRLQDGSMNPEISTQKSIHAVIGTEYTFNAWNRPFKISADVYYKWLKNLIPYQIDNVRIRYSGMNQADGYAAGVDLKINGEFVPGAESWFSLALLKTEEDIRNDSYINSEGKTVFPGYYPRPTDQRVNIGLFFQDYLPGNSTFRVHLSGHYGSGLPFGLPKSQRYDLLSRMPSYKRVDIGFTKVLKDDTGEGGTVFNQYRWLKSLWIGAEVFNLLNFNNTVSYLWIQTVENQSHSAGVYAVPNYLTSRRINIKVVAKF